MINFFSFFKERISEISLLTLEHIELTAIAVGLAIIVGVPLGILLTRYKKISSMVLGTASIIQTIPSLALLGFMVPLFGIGTKPSIVALFLYALLPIIRNTYTGIVGVEPALIEAGIGMGMTNFELLYMVELPLALPVIIAGIRTSAVINVGITTLCALIGAGGLGQLIFRGISMVNTNMILSGAIPAALLALFLDFLLGQTEKLLSPNRG